MSSASSVLANRYILNAANSARAIEQGLAEADWYTSAVPMSELRRLLARRNGPAIRDTLIWFALLGGTGAWGYAWWGSGWAVIPFALYGVLYASVSDSRWHEAGHGTAFKTDWMNNALYELASFMVMRESVPWRWSHTRHHSDTVIVGRDPEIHVPRPPNLRAIVLSFFNFKAPLAYPKSVLLHACGRISEGERTFVPEAVHGRIFFRARIYAAIYAAVIGWAIYMHSILPLMFIGLPNFYGAWLMVIYGYTQHAGLAENVLDHRLNCRTIEMNFINRFLYWNMNFHLEHHMFPLVPYHALPRLHALVQDDCPPAYASILAAYQEIIPTIVRQVKDPAYHVRRRLPTPTDRRGAASTAIVFTSENRADTNGWVEVGAADQLGREDVIRFDHARKSYALYRTADGQLYATDGMCTHGNTHLAGGLVKGKLIECPKHNGRFDLTNGAAVRPPACLALRTYPVENRAGKLLLHITAPGGLGAHEPKPHRFRVVSNGNVATFIKELVLEPLEATAGFRFTPGDYLQLDIPAYERISFRDFDIRDPFRAVWETQHVFDFTSTNPGPTRRNYSLACNGERERTLRFNVRIATPPRGQDCAAGAGSSYVFALQPGDTVTAIGPFGDFHLKPTQREMTYIGGGAGMAPLRAHLSHLFETQRTPRKVSFWYGARSRQEIFYQDYFGRLAREFPNFSFHVALSEPIAADAWTGPTGFIHDVVRDTYLNAHPNPRAVEYYLCGPPAMIKAALALLQDFHVPSAQIAFDEF